MIVLAGGDLVLPDGILTRASLVVDGDRIVAVAPKGRVDPAGATIVELDDHYVVPGFIDVHVHGVEGFDTLDPGDPVAEIASRLPRYGVTAFCPTTVACSPQSLRAVLAQVGRARVALSSHGARVLPAHLESNFINPHYRGAQPAECLRIPGGGSASRNPPYEWTSSSAHEVGGGSAPRNPPYEWTTSPTHEVVSPGAGSASPNPPYERTSDSPHEVGGGSAPRNPLDEWTSGSTQGMQRPGFADDVRRPGSAQRTRREESDDFSASDILDVIAAFRLDVGVVTLAPELPGGIELVRTLVSAGHRVSLGHSGASLDEAMAAIDAGARQATHLFNGMAPMTHRAPGVAGAVLVRDEVAVELICDGYHVHPAMGRIAIRSKGVGRVIAITDGTAGSGLAVGASARLGGRRIRVTGDAAVLDDGTLAGSTLTMDRAFKTIVTVFGLSVCEAAMLCSTTPARDLELSGLGVLAEDAYADITVLDRSFHVVRTFVGGREVYSKDGATQP